MEFSTWELGSQINDYRMALTTARFERDYEQVFSRTTQLLDAERSRMQCIKQLLLQIEKDSLQLQLDQANKELIQTISAESDALLQLQDTRKQIDRLQNIVNASSHEIDNLRHELGSLNDATTESKKLLSEKNRLSKEVLDLQSEVERLHSRNNSSNALLAEKQALGRQLNTLEVQLEQEKRAHERTMTKNSQQTEEIADLSSKIEATCRELEKSRAHAHGLVAPRTHERKSQHGKIERLDPKLLPMKDQIPEPLADPRDPRDSSVLAGNSSTASIQKAPVKLNPELTIATPGAVHFRGQQKRPFALPGDKSSFSITPFLNRTTGVQDSTMSSDDELDEPQTVGKHISPHGLSSKRAYGEGKAISFRNRTVLASGQQHRTGNQALNKASLNGNVRHGKKMKLPSDSDSGDEIGELSILQPRRPIQAPAQSRKRKLGTQRDKSLFDDEEDDGGLCGPGKPARKFIAGQIHKSHIPTARVPEFSPLKRDKKRL